MQVRLEVLKGSAEQALWVVMGAVGSIQHKHYKPQGTLQGHQSVRSSRGAISFPFCLEVGKFRRSDFTFYGTLRKFVSFTIPMKESNCPLELLIAPPRGTTSGGGTVRFSAAPEISRQVHGTAA
ncbi:hypothetical protein E2C01_041685 [Portunus trituberculatus]|uniref:Uncharacterized protein n=1 Tax=Portunus trituberculatus TaxID=210409 RepID=A0A5B7FUD6_PORTR|nr:hypothetical protein [Portunus trituberculatus]